MKKHTLPVFDAHQLASKLLDGSPALFPTDTLPALAALPRDASMLWDLKQRPKHKPLILMAAEAAPLMELMYEETRHAADSLIRRYWPGALTLVVPYQGSVLESLNPCGSSIGMRVPNCEATRQLLSMSGPLATTSANLSGQPPCKSAELAAQCFPGLPLLGPLPWLVPSGVASTVLAWEEAGHWQVLRQGAVMAELP